MAKKSNLQKKFKKPNITNFAKNDFESFKRKKQNNESIKKSNSNNSSSFNNLQKKNSYYYNNKYIINKLKNIVNNTNLSDEYKKRIISLFKNFLNFQTQGNKKNEKYSNFLKKFNNGTKIEKIKINDVLNYVEENTNFKSESTKYYNLLKFRKFIRLINNEKNLNYNQKLINIKKDDKFFITEKELYSIINNLKDNDDLENLCVFYLLYIKGFNFTMISRIRIIDFKSGFSKLIIKKSKTMKYAIPSLLKKKLEEISMNNNFSSQFFFYNNISENKNNRRATFIRNIFKNIINNSFGITEERKIEILNILSSKRKPKINFNDDIFFNDFGFTFGFFDPNLSPFSKKSLESFNSNIDGFSEEINKIERKETKNIYNNFYFDEKEEKNKLENDFFIKRNKENMDKCNGKEIEYNFNVSISSFDSNFI